MVVFRAACTARQKRQYEKRARLPCAGRSGGAARARGAAGRLVRAGVLGGGVVVAIGGGGRVRSALLGCLLGRRRVALAFRGAIPLVWGAR